MIRNFELFCNLNRIKHSDFSLLQRALHSLDPANCVCPACGAAHSCTLHSHYHRDFICIDHSNTVCHSVSIPRLICSSCNHTHAFLPASLIPHASFSLFFILTVLRSYFLRNNTVAHICEHFSIATSTLYQWLHLFSLQKELWLGILKNAAASSDGFLDLLFNQEHFLTSFFHKFRFSFLQGHQPATRYRRT